MSIGFTRLLRRRLAATVVVCGLLARANDARADEGSKSYGYQTLIADGLSVGTGLLIGLSTTDEGSSDLGYISNGVAGALVGAMFFVSLAPVVHFAHGNVGKGFGSLGLRVGAIIVGAAAGLDDDFDDEDEPSVLPMLGLTVLASVLDAVLLARDLVSDGESSASPRLLFQVGRRF